MADHFTNKTFPEVSATRRFVCTVLSKLTKRPYYEVYQHLAGEYVIDTSNLAALGSFREGRLHLEDGEIAQLIHDFKPKFQYYFDAVRDEQGSYRYEECASLPNDGEVVIRSEDPEVGVTRYYVPHSLIDIIEMVNRDVVFEHDGNYARSSTSFMRPYRWELIALKYWPNYENVWFSVLIDQLPKGDQVLARYESETSGAVGSAGEGTSGEGGGDNYYVGDPYADVPLGSNGMTRAWHMTQAGGLPGRVFRRNGWDRSRILSVNALSRLWRSWIGMMRQAIRMKY